MSGTVDERRRGARSSGSMSDDNNLTGELVREALEDHGLWIGLFSSEPLKVCGESVDSPHCTVIHLGRRTRGAMGAVGVDEMCRCAEATCRWLASLSRGVIRCRIDGVARFASTTPEGNPLVALLKSRQLGELRVEVIQHLSSGSKLPFSSFEGDFGGYLPHVTIRRVPEAAPVVIHGPMTIPRPVWPEISWTHVGVTCGRVTGRWSL